MGRRQSGAIVMLAAAAALAIAACGGKSATRADATTDATTDAGADSGAARCDPALQDCPAGSRCDSGCEGGHSVFTCQTGVDGGASADLCSATVPCARGAGCVGALDGGNWCRTYCAVDDDCPTGQRCMTVSFTFFACSGAEITNLRLCY